MKITHLKKLNRKKKWKLDGSFGGKRVRLFFLTEGEAKAERARLTGERAEAGPVADRLTPAERISFAAIRDRLDDYGATIEDAAKFFLEHAVATGDPLRMRDLLEAALAAKGAEGKSDRYLNSMSSSVGQFCAWGGNGFRWAHEIRLEDVMGWVEGNGWASATRRTYLIDLRTVFEFGIKAGALRLNPLAGIDLPSAGESDIVVMSPMDAARLVSRCLASGRGCFAHESFGSLLPYVVLGLFCGVRPEEELGTLRLGAIHLDEGAVVLEAAAAKSRRRRVVDLSPNAVALLRVGIPLLEDHWRERKVHPRSRDDFKVCPPNFKRRWERFRVACGFALGKQCPGDGVRWWKSDIMRHSYASYHYAEHQNENLLKAQMGHQSHSSVLFQNYRLRVTRKDAGRFWGLGLSREV